MEISEETLDKVGNWNTIEKGKREKEKQVVSPTDLHAHTHIYTHTTVMKVPD